MLPTLPPPKASLPVLPKWKLENMRRKNLGAWAMILAGLLWAAFAIRFYLGRLMLAAFAITPRPELAEYGAFLLGLVLVGGGWYHLWDHRRHQRAYDEAQSAQKPEA